MRFTDKKYSGSKTKKGRTGRSGYQKQRRSAREKKVIDDSLG
jgi:hypothetical protein